MRYVSMVFITTILFFLVLGEVSHASADSPSLKYQAIQHRLLVLQRSATRQASIANPTDPDAMPLSASQTRLTGTGSIAGSVFGLDSTTWGKAYVEAFMADSTGAASEGSKGLAFINPDGSYQIDGLLAGDFYVFTWADGYVIKYYNNVTDMGAATWVTVKDGTITRGIDFRMERLIPGTGSISGQVVNAADGHPIALAQVSVSAADDPYSYGWAQTDTDGYYRITGLKTGKYYASAWAEGYLPEYYPDATSPDQATLVEVIEPNETTAIRFTLILGGIISGQVTHDDSTPIPWAYVEAFSTIIDSTFFPERKPQYGYGWKAAYTDENGRYRMIGLPADTFFVRAQAWSKWSYTSEWYQNAGSLEKATPIPVQPGQEVTGIDFQLTLAIAKGVIAGHITDLQGDALPDVWVQAQSIQDTPDQSPVWAYATTDASGNYRIEELPDGRYLVSAWSQNGWSGVQRWWPDADNPESAQPVAITNGTALGPIDFKLPVTAGTATISGYVRSSDGRLLAGVSIDVSPAQQTEPKRFALWAWGCTDSTGYYRVDRLPAGSYIIHASYWENVSFGQQWFDQADSLAAATPVVLQDKELREQINFNLTVKPMFGSIVGTVIDSLTGLPINRAYLEIAFKDGQNSFMPIRFSSFYAITDDKGRYQIDWLREGEYLVSVYTNGAFEYYDNAVVVDLATPVQITGGNITTVNFALVAQADGKGVISGQVGYDWEGSPVEIAVVTARPAITITLWPQSEQFYTAITRPDGSYELTGLPAGEYYVQSFAPYTIGEYYDNVFDPAQATPVKVDGVQPTTGIDFTLTPIRFLWDKGPGPELGNSSTIVGKVVDGQGQPVANANVYLLDTHGQPVSFTRTHADGSYELSGLPPGNYLLQASKLGYDSQYNGNVDELAQATPVTIGNSRMEMDFILPLQNTTGIIATDEKLPRTVALYGSYPNPFNPETRIVFALPQPMTVRLVIYNIRGELVAELVDALLTAGKHSIPWNGRSFSGQVVTSGVYFYRLDAGPVSHLGKMILMR